MSEENTSTENSCATKKMNCQKKLLILTLIISLVSFCLSTFIAVKLGVFSPDGQIHQPNENFLISKKYDKGQSLEKALATKKPVIVWFYADWCGYCKKFAPTFEKLTKDRDIKKNFAIAFVNCDTAENVKFVKEFNIQGFPTLYLISADRKVRTMVAQELLFDAEAVEKLEDNFTDFADVNDNDKNDKD